MTKILTEILWLVVKLFSLLPLKVLYVISDFCYVVIYHVIKYRRKVARTNIDTAFPEKPERERRQIERDFYHYFCDFFIEMIKFIDISNEDFLTKHVIYYNVEEVDESFSQGKDITCLLGHYGNWEWLDGTQLCFKVNRTAGVGLIYHRLRNKAAHEVKMRIMSCKNGITIDKDSLLRTVVRYKNEDQRMLYGLVADQSPKWQNIHMWLNFLNHDTPVFTGSQRIAQKMNHAVYYMAMRREARGRYTLHYEKICDNAKDMSIEEMTRIFFEKLEAQVREDPVLYLWTHDRWKRTKEEFDRRFIVKGGRVIERKDVEQ